MHGLNPYTYFKELRYTKKSGFSTERLFEFWKYRRALIKYDLPWLLVSLPLMPFTLTIALIGVLCEGVWRLSSWLLSVFPAPRHFFSKKWQEDYKKKEREFFTALHEIRNEDRHILARKHSEQKAHVANGNDAIH